MRGVKESDDTILPTKIKIKCYHVHAPLRTSSTSSPESLRSTFTRRDGFDGTLSSYTCASYVTSISHFTQKTSRAGAAEEEAAWYMVRTVQDAQPLLQTICPTYTGIRYHKCYAVPVYQGACCQVLQTVGQSSECWFLIALRTITTVQCRSLRILNFRRDLY